MNSDFSRKPTITWVTPHYFVDCDFNPEILERILEQFEIRWIILLPHRNARFKVQDFDELRSLKGLTIEFMQAKYRQRDPRGLNYYFQLYKRIRHLNSDVNYLNCVPDPYLMPFYWLLNKEKTIFCAHDGDVSHVFEFRWIRSIVFNLAYRYIKYCCMFSPSQAGLFKKKFPKVKIFVISLALKSFGKGTSTRADNQVNFLSFGVLNYSKNVDLLIEAACNLYEKGHRNFKVSINGNCANWEFYRSLIRYPEIFDCSIRMIDNSEIPDMFSSAHYFVQPYRYVSQSGALKVAFNYNVPVIATNYPGFADEIRVGVNGYLFNPGDVKDLEKIMLDALASHQSGYKLLSEKMARYTSEHYSANTLGGKYLQMFNEVIERARD